MIYIKCVKNYLEYFEEKKDFPNILKKIIFIYRKIFGKITKIQEEKGEIWLIPENNKKFQKNILKNLDIYHVKNVVLSKQLMFLKNEIESKKVKILNGKWLYKYLIFNIIEFICKNKEENIEEQVLSFIIKNPDDVDFENIKKIAKNVKTLNLITKDEYRFRRLEQILYNENGIILDNSYNYKKSLLKSNIIINIDMDEKEFNKFAIPRKAIIINLNDVKIYNKGFNGINVTKYEIKFPEKYNDNFLNIDSFNKEILYESFIYKKTAVKNILNEIKQDDIEISDLTGINGLINKKEYLKV